jgi:tRNA-specific 2-thiouridylase
MDYFLKEKCGIKTGDIIDKSGKTTGHHQGLWFYTIGQRRGIGLSGGPFYAVAKNCAKNQLIITSRKRDLVSDLVNLKDVLWVSSHKPELPLKIKARIRYRAKEANAILRKNRGGFELKFDKPQFAVTPGQSAVFYGGNELIGGGKIK